MATSRTGVGRIQRVGLAACAVAWTLALTAHADDRGWRVLRRESGIVTSVRERAGQELPAFRARATVRASVWELMAVLSDVEGACDWSSHCGEMRQVARHSELDRLVYSRLDAPWPIRDRDVLVRVTVENPKAGQLVVRVRAQHSSRVPPQNDVVRMPHFDAAYRLRVIDSSRTLVQYEVEVDPGGHLPDWVKRRVAEDFPHEALQTLRERLAAERDRPDCQAQARVLESAGRARGFQTSSPPSPAEVAALGH